MSGRKRGSFFLASREHIPGSHFDKEGSRMTRPQSTSEVMQRRMITAVMDELNTPEALRAHVFAVIFSSQPGREHFVSMEVDVHITRICNLLWFGRDQSGTPLHLYSHASSKCSGEVNIQAWAMKASIPGSYILHGTRAIQTADALQLLRAYLASLTLPHHFGESGTNGLLEIVTAIRMLAHNENKIHQDVAIEIAPLLGEMRKRVSKIHGTVGQKCMDVHLSHVGLTWNENDGAYVAALRFA
jgi:hypothetical protein